MKSEVERIIDEMNEYYSRRASMHDWYMGYSSNEELENLLKPIIDEIEIYIKGRDVLEIACGTGNWTQVLSKRAKSVLATDINETVLDIAGNKEYPNDNVTFKCVDAYTLDSIDDKFNAAFAIDWFSHMPKSKINTFLQTLHSKLVSGASVVFIDMMNTPFFDQLLLYRDNEGNCVSRRILPDDLEFRVIKNFPAKEELTECVGDFALEINYQENVELMRWILAYKVFHIPFQGISNDQ